MVELTSHAKARAEKIGETDEKIASAPGELRKALVAFLVDAGGSQQSVSEDISLLL